jgi:GntR family phosphonate transport system transcriptional regulator
MDEMDFSAVRAAAGGGEKNAASVWSSIESVLAEEIATGRLAPGARLESEHRLAARFGVNRHTVRHALGQLAANGLVHVKHGLGTFVTDVAVDYVLGRRTRFTENLSARGLQGRQRFLEATVTKATAAIAKALDIRIDTQVHRILAIGEANQRAITLAEHYFPARRFRNLPEIYAEACSVSAALAAFGVGDYTRQRSVISARLPGKEIAGWLQQSTRRPVLFVEAVNVDNAGVPVEYGRTWFAGDVVQLIVEPEA